MPDWLDEIEARWEAATPGPWQAREDWHDGPLYGVSQSSDGDLFAGVSLETQEAEKATAQAIAHAPTDIAKLIEAVRDWMADREKGAKGVEKASDALAKALEKAEKDVLDFGAHPPRTR